MMCAKYVCPISHIIYIHTDSDAKISDFRKWVGNFRKFPEISGNFRKDGLHAKVSGKTEIFGNFRKFPERFGNFRKFPERLGNFRKFPERLGNFQKHGRHGNIEE